MKTEVPLKRRKHGAKKVGKQLCVDIAQFDSDIETTHTYLKNMYMEGPVFSVIDAYNSALIINVNKWFAPTFK